MSDEQKNYIIEDFNVLVAYFKKTKGVTLEEHLNNIELYFRKIYHNALIHIEGQKLIVDGEILTEYKE